MERLVLKIYDDVQDRSPLYCGGGAALFVVMAWREFSGADELGFRLWLLLLAALVFAVAAMVLVRSHLMRIEVEEECLKIIRRGCQDQVIAKSQLGYVKKEENRVMIHHYEGDDLRHLSFPTRGISKRDIEAVLEVLENWLKND